MRMSRIVKIAAVVAIAVSIGVLAYALLTPSNTSDTSDHMGMGWHTSYDAANVGLIAVSIVVIVASLTVAVLWEGYEPLRPDQVLPPRAEMSPPAPIVVPDVPQLPKLDVDDAAAHNFLVLRLLTGDERTMFKAIMDSSGEALQKDLIVRTKMSNAKVSRVLGRLEEKGVVTKDRHGATNKIRIKLEQ